MYMEGMDQVKLFKVEEEKYDFKREEFIWELGKEFVDYWESRRIGIDKKSGNIQQQGFREIVKNLESKLWGM